MLICTGTHTVCYNQKMKRGASDGNPGVGKRSILKMVNQSSKLVAHLA